MDEREPDCCGDNCGENRYKCTLPALRCDETAQTNWRRPWLLGSNFWNEVRCNCKVTDHGTCHWCQNERNDQINIVDDRQTEEQRLVDVENARNDCHFAEFTHLVRLGHESHVQNCTKRSTWTTDRDERVDEVTGKDMETTGNVWSHVCQNECVREAHNDCCAVDTEEPKEMNQEDDDQNAPPCADQSGYEWERNVKQAEDVSVAHDQNGIDEQNDDCDYETWNKRREWIRNALWNRVWHLDWPALFYAETVDLDCQGSDDESCENAGCTNARKSGTILFVSRIKSKMIQKKRHYGLKRAGFPLDNELPSFLARTTKGMTPVEYRNHALTT